MSKIYFSIIKPLLIFIYRNSFQKICVNILSYGVSKKSDELCNKILGNQSGNKILFNSFEYQTFDCLSLYAGVARNMRKKNCYTQNLKFKHLNIKEFINSKSSDKKNYNYKYSLKKLKYQCKKYDLVDLYYPIIDTIHKNHYNIWKYNFNETFCLNKNFFLDLIKLKKNFAKLALEFDILIITDTGYIYNHLIKQEFLKKNKKVFCLGPANVFFKYSNIYDSEVSCLNKKEQVLAYNRNKFKIDKFLKKRFSGKIKSGFYNISFQDKKKTKINKNYKILYLHSFTDANNNAWYPNQIFSSHFEWTDFTLRELAKKKFKNWHIKIHPVQLLAKKKSISVNNQAFGTNAIVDYFVDKYNIPEEVLNNCPKNIDILKNKLPIYTNSGTVVLESLNFGNNTIFTGARFDKLFGNKIYNKKKWIKVLHKKIYSKKKIPSKTLKQAKYVLWYQYSKDTFISNLCPDDHIAAWTNMFGKFTLLIKYFLKIYNFSKK